MKKIIIVCSVFTLLLHSCQKDDLEPDFEPSATIEAVNEYNLVSQIFQDIGNHSGDAIINVEKYAAAKSSGSKENIQSLDDGPVITVAPLDFTTFPKTITVDFKSGILGKDGVTRKGMVTIVSTGWYGETDSEHTTSFKDYYHNTYKVEGTHLVKNLGKNPDDSLRYSVIINNGKLSKETGEFIEFVENSYRNWIKGIDTPLNIWDDEYLLEGVQSGTSSKGISYKLSIEDLLHFVLLPRSILSGIVSLDIAKIKDIKINYTNGTITFLGVEYPLNN